MLDKVYQGIPNYLLTSHLLAFWNAWTCYCGKCWDKDFKGIYKNNLIEIDKSRLEDSQIPSIEFTE